MVICKLIMMQIFLKNYGSAFQLRLWRWNCFQECAGASNICSQIAAAAPSVYLLFNITFCPQHSQCFPLPLSRVGVPRSTITLR